MEVSSFSVFGLSSFSLQKHLHFKAQYTSILSCKCVDSIAARCGLDGLGIEAL